MKVSFSKKTTQNPLINLFEYLLWICIILDFNTVYLYNGNSHFYKYFASGIIILLLTIKKKFVITKNVITTIYVYLLYIVVWHLISSKFNISIDFISRFVIFLPLMLVLLYYTNDTRDFLKKFSNIMLALAVLSLVFWTLGTLTNVIDSSIYSKMYWGQTNDNYVSVKNYFYVYFETSANYKIFGINSARNDGIFCEGPMYAALLILGLMYELYFEERPSKIKCVIYTLTTISTISMTGWIVVIFMFVYKYLVKREKNQNGIIIKFFVGAILVVSAIYGVYSFIELKSSTDSFLIRIDDYISGFRSWIQSPIWGNGYDNTDALEVQMSSWRLDNKGISNSITSVLSQGGIMWFSVYIAGFYSYFKLAQKLKNKNYYGFLFVFILMFITVVFYTRLIMIVLLALGFSSCLKLRRSSIVI